MPESSHHLKCKFSTKSISPEYAKFKVCASYYHHYTFFKDLFADIEGGYITSIGNKRPLSGLDKFHMSLTCFTAASQGMEPIIVYQK